MKYSSFKIESPSLVYEPLIQVYLLVTSYLPLLQKFSPVIRLLLIEEHSSFFLKNKITLLFFFQHIDFSHHKTTFTRQFEVYY